MAFEKKERNAVIAKDYNDGMRVESIAQKHEISTPRLREILTRLESQGAIILRRAKRRATQ